MSGTYFFDKYGPPCDVYGTYFLINMDSQELILLLNMGTDKFGKHIAGGEALI